MEGDSDKEKYFDTVVRCFQLNAEEIEMDTEIVPLGMDSVQYVERMVDIEEAFDIEFEDEMLVGGYFNTIGDMVEYLKKVCSSEE